MGIEVPERVVEEIHKTPGSIVIGVVGASDPDAAGAALAAARADIARLDGGWRSAPGLTSVDANTPKYVSAVMPAGRGPFLMIDGGEVPGDLLATIPDIVVRHLEEAGIVDAVVDTCDPPGPLMGRLPDRPERVVRAHLFRDPTLPGRPVGARSTLPDEWMAEALGWLGDPTEGSDFGVAVVSAEFPVAPTGARALLERCRAVRAPLTLVNGTPSARVRAASVDFLPATANLVLAGGGPQSDDPELLATATELIEIARRLAVSSSYVSLDIGDGLRPQITQWSRAGGASGVTATFFCDEFAIEAYPYQIIGDAHMARLDQAKRFKDGRPARRWRRKVVSGSLSGEKTEVFIGRLEDWLPDSGADMRTVRGEAQRFLMPCLLTGEESQLRLAAAREAMYRRGRSASRRESGDNAV